MKAEIINLIDFTPHRAGAVLCLNCFKKHISVSPEQYSNNQECPYCHEMSCFYYDDLTNEIILDKVVEKLGKILS